MKLFLGEYDHALDERGRVTLPKKMRAEIEEKEIVLSRGFDTCIFGFDKGSWEREAEKHLESPVTDAGSRDLRRYLFAAAQKVEIDKLGRILVPALLKEYASIRHEVVILGAGDHFEIWDKRKWEAHAAAIEKT